MFSVPHNIVIDMNNVMIIAQIRVSRIRGHVIGYDSQRHKHVWSLGRSVNRLTCGLTHVTGYEFQMTNVVIFKF